MQKQQQQVFCLSKQKASFAMTSKCLQQMKEQTLAQKLDALQAAAQNILHQQTKDLTQLCVREERKEQLQATNAEMQKGQITGQRERAQLEALVERESDRLKERLMLLKELEATTATLEAQRERSRQLQSASDTIASRVETCAHTATDDDAVMTAALRKAAQLTKGRSCADYRSQINECKRRRATVEGTRAAFRKGKGPSDFPELVEGWLKSDTELEALVRPQLEAAIALVNSKRMSLNRNTMLEALTPCTCAATHVEHKHQRDTLLVQVLPDAVDELLQMIQAATTTDECFLESTTEAHFKDLTEVEQKLFIPRQATSNASAMHHGKTIVATLESIELVHAKCEGLHQRLQVCRADNAASAAETQKLHENVNESTQSNGCSAKELDVGREKARALTDAMREVATSLSITGIELGATLRVVEDTANCCEAHTTKLAALSVQRRHAEAEESKNRQAVEQATSEAQDQLDRVATAHTTTLSDFIAKEASLALLLDIDRELVEQTNRMLLLGNNSTSGESDSSCSDEPSSFVGPVASTLVQFEEMLIEHLLNNKQHEDDGTTTSTTPCCGLIVLSKNGRRVKDMIAQNPCLRQSVDGVFNNKHANGMNIAHVDFPPADTPQDLLERIRTTLQDPHVNRDGAQHQTRVAQLESAVGNADIACAALRKKLL